MSNWKHAERRVARLFDGERTGPTGRDDNDVTHDQLAIEVKYRKRLPAWALACLEQARAGRSAAGKVPVVVLLGRGMRTEDGLVVMRLCDMLGLLSKEGPERAPSEGILEAFSGR